MIISADCVKDRDNADYEDHFAVVYLCRRLPHLTIEQYLDHYHKASIEWRGLQTDFWYLIDHLPEYWLVSLLASLAYSRLQVHFEIARRMPGLIRYVQLPVKRHGFMSTCSQSTYDSVSLYVYRNEEA
jgi:hypothetical protein